MEFTLDSMSPELFRLWCAITLVGGALERRVWAMTKVGPVYGNLFTLLVAPPGVGKGIIEKARECWTLSTKPGTKLPAFHVAPDSMTKAALMDTLAISKSVFLTKKAPVIYHSLLIASEEFSVLVPSYDMEYIGSLNSIWNNKALHSEQRRYGKNSELRIENPQLTILAGTQPSYMASLFPEEAWNSGLARRLMMIYVGDHPVEDIFGASVDNQLAKAKVLHKLGAMSELYGEITWHPEAMEELRAWNLAGGPPAPTHTKLVHYNRSRTFHVIKLCAISAVSRVAGDPKAKLEIIPSDFTRAREWILFAERFMPDVFRAMVGKSDRDVIDELHRYALTEYYKVKGAPLEGQMLRRFLLTRVPHDKVESILLTADRAGILVRDLSVSPGDRWRPTAMGNAGTIE